MVRVFNAAGSTGYQPLWIVPGSLKVTEGRSEGIPMMDRGVLKTTVLDGDERPSSIEFKVRPTKLGLTASTDLLTVCENAIGSDGTKTLYNVEIDWPDAKTGSTGARAAFAGCFLENATEIQAGGSGANVDEVTIKIRSQTARATWTTY